MREIKFRAWDEDNKCWLPSSFFEKGELFLNWETNDSGIFYIHDKTADGHTCITLEQFTGLSDKNGKEIYENDIIEFQSGLKPERATIEFQIHCYNAGFYPNKPVNGSQYWEIIGTIHENPELLK